MPKSKSRSKLVYVCPEQENADKLEGLYDPNIPEQHPCFPCMGGGEIKIINGRVRMTRCKYDRSDLPEINVPAIPNDADISDAELEKIPPFLRPNRQTEREKRFSEAMRKAYLR